MDVNAAGEDHLRMEVQEIFANHVGFCIFRRTWQFEPVHCFCSACAGSLNLDQKNKEEVSIVAAGQWEYILITFCAPHN